MLQISILMSAVSGGSESPAREISDFSPSSQRIKRIEH